jgi:hypothetical protein
MKWNKTIEQVPKNEEKVLACYHGFYKLLVWNSSDNCWDDWEWGDYFCEKEQVKYWMSLPEMPKI